MTTPIKQVRLDLERAVAILRRLTVVCTQASWLHLHEEPDCDCKSCTLERAKQFLKEVDAR